MAFSEVKQLTCPFFSDKMPGLLDKSAWRIDKFIFSTDDFSKDTPNLTHHFVVSYKIPDDELNIEKLEIENCPKELGSACEEVNKMLTEPFYEERSYNVSYSISPTNLSLTNPENGFFSINRSTLELTFAGNKSKCSISDVEIPNSNVF